MRLWSLHPKYLDSRGLVALWREALLAKSILQKRNTTTGYCNHPQLKRFKEACDPIGYINSYLAIIHMESVRRNYDFALDKIGLCIRGYMWVTRGQLDYERQLLAHKLEYREDIGRERLTPSPEANPLFSVVLGPMECWEKAPALFSPNYGSCFRCHRTWNICNWYATDHGNGRCFPLCEDCWKELTPKQRLSFYVLLIKDWEKQGCKETQEKTDAIIKAVLDGK